MKTFITSSAVLFLFCFSYLFGQENVHNGTFTKNQIATLSMGINSVNEGIRKSSIFYAGFYNVYQVIPDLRNQLQQERKPQLKALIAMSLLLLGDSESVELIKTEAGKPENIAVKNRLNAIAGQFLLYSSNNR